MEILQTPLFRGIQEAELAEMQQRAGMRRRTYTKNERLFSMGTVVSETGIVLHGSVNIETIDPWGGKSILSNVPTGQVFAETYAFCGEPLMVDVVAAEDCAILLLDMQLLLREGDAPWQQKLLQNLLGILVQKNLTLANRIFCTTPKGTRGRILTYLSGQAAKNGSMTFQIPFDRQQMADYLNLDRSALSKELGRMREEGLLTFRKNTFTLHQK